MLFFVPMNLYELDTNEKKEKTRERERDRKEEKGGHKNAMLPWSLVMHLARKEKSN